MDNTGKIRMYVRRKIGPVERDNGHGMITNSDATFSVAPNSVDPNATSGPLSPLSVRLLAYSATTPPDVARAPSYAPLPCNPVPAHAGALSLLSCCQWACFPTSVSECRVSTEGAGLRENSRKESLYQLHLDF
jgi:hypothetical protein